MVRTPRAGGASFPRVRRHRDTLLRRPTCAWPVDQPRATENRVEAERAALPYARSIQEIFVRRQGTEEEIHNVGERTQIS